MTLQDLSAQYVALRKSLGEHGAGAESVLKTFCRQIGTEIDVEEIRAERVTAFLAGTGPVTRYWHRKYGVLRGFYGVVKLSV